MTSDAMTSPAVGVCACTHRRPQGLAALLEGLERQEFSAVPPPDIHIVIADNEGSTQTRQICDQFRERSGISTTYVHEPERGIPYARNACLDHLPPECEFFAFIDDDEVPAADWLEQLLLAQARAKAEVVAGKVVPILPEGAPPWIVSGGFFGSPRRWLELDVPQREDLQVLECAATNNVLVRLEPVRLLGLRFETEFAFSGGSDALFFRTLHKAGYRIAFAERAVVYDYIPMNRATLSYMCRERFRVANNNVFIDALIKERPPSFSRDALKGFKHLGLAARRAAKTLLGPSRSADRFALGAFHMAHGLGMIAGAFGYRYQHYR